MGAGPFLPCHIPVCSQVTTASKLTSLGLLFLFRLFIIQASLSLVISVPACSFLERSFKVQFTNTKVLAFPSGDVNSKRQGTEYEFEAACAGQG